MRLFHSRSSANDIRVNQSIESFERLREGLYQATGYSRIPDFIALPVVSQIEQVEQVATEADEPTIEFSPEELIFEAHRDRFRQKIRNDISLEEAQTQQMPAIAPELGSTS